MQKAVTPVNSSENDYFADDAVDEAEETDTRIRQCPSEDDRFATCGLPIISICLEAVKKKRNNSLKDCRKQRLNTAWKSAPRTAKFDTRSPSMAKYNVCSDSQVARRSVSLDPTNC